MGRVVSEPGGLTTGFGSFLQANKSGSPSETTNATIVSDFIIFDVEWFRYKKTS